jgi:osmotically-inducible protein OsmY
MNAKGSLADNEQISHLRGKAGCLEENQGGEPTATHPMAGRVAEAREVDRKPLGNAPGVCQRTDAEIAKAAIDALSWDVFAPPNGIEVIVQEGRLTLLGKVQGIYQRDRIESAVQHLAGVNAIDNRILIRPPLRRSQIEASIYEAFDKNVHTDLRYVHVTLTGRVQSRTEHEELLRATWSTAGVTDVETMITVGEPAANLVSKTTTKDENI